MLLKLVLVAVSCCIGFIVADCDNGVYKMGTTQSDINEILKKHNQLRNDIMNGRVPGQPRGTNLKTLKWDRTLASKAQEIANTCEFEHVTVRGTRWDWVGQNLGLSMISRHQNANPEWSDTIQSWFDEHKNFEYPNRSRGVTGHYTQVVWADTEFVGCGYTYYLDDQNYYTKLYVCNYGPGGNIVGRPPYKV